MRLRTLWLTGLAVVLSAPSVAAQVRPDLRWETIASSPFRVHFTAELEPLARRTLANAEAAYAKLAAELPVPRGIIDIVVADNIDAANGLATPYPSNRIVVFARPPVDEPLLRNHEDWNLLLVTHELAHIFQLDRADGWWGLAQRVFGRAAPFFPHTYAPRWLLEGVAIHYETRFTRGGRLANTEREAQLRALADGAIVPALDALTLPWPFYPGGNVAYLLGAETVRGVLRHDPTLGEDVAMARLFDRMSRRINPWRLDASAREAVGASFSDVYGTWRESLRRSVREVGYGSDARSRTITRHEFTAAYPRFVHDRDDLISYVANDARQMPGVYRVWTSGPQAQRSRFSRRNSVDPHVPLRGRRGLHTELDRIDPYTVRGDLYADAGRWRQRLTVDARLAHVDAHPESGAAVAVRTLPGSTELVWFTLAGARPGAVALRTLAAGTLDRAWSEPRLSRSGSLVAAAEWRRGGRTAIVVMDSLGRERMRFAPRASDGSERLVLVAGPAWMPGDSLLLFTSDHEGRPMVYRGDVRSGAYQRLWATGTSLRSPDVSANGTRVVATELRARGWVVVTRPLDDVPPMPDAPPAADARPLPPLPEAAASAAAKSRYRAWPTARPMWWLPSVASSDEDASLVGVMTGGQDVVGRHTWQASLLQDVTRAERTGSLAYAWAGLGNPVLTFAGLQEFSHLRVTASGDPDTEVGRISLRERSLSATMLAMRPRARVSSFVIAGPELVVRDGRAYPDSLASMLADPSFLDTQARVAGVLSVGVSTMQRPGLSVSVEDGIAVQATARYRADDGIGKRDVREGIVQGSVAKSLPLPGFARHVVALRGAYGVADSYTRRPFDVGGVSGGSLEVLPGLAVGDPTRTFFVRGAVPATQRGNRAAAFSGEYRAPLTRVGRGVGLAPLFLQKLSLLAFADAGAAWCAGEVAGSPVCGPGAPPRAWMASGGAELVLDAALSYDILYRVRLGFARALQGIAAVDRGATLYLTLGNTF
ncbi:MAG: hypothetical protein KF689_09570 [Gemmatimonadaceae bacterium]|nr:hypothetical protein [Gemmatimonadaceae bacterium]MCW5826153.1 hypothetical protein [Gemmatimonadaceae bacterium]